MHHGEATIAEPIVPQNIDAEQAVLGALVYAAAEGSGGEALERVRAEGLRANDFYWQGHGTIYRTIGDLHDRGEPFDLLTVREELQQHGLLEEVGGQARLRDLLGSALSTTNAPHHARLILEAAGRRRTYLAAKQLAAAAQTGVELDEALADARAVLDDPGARGAKLKPLWWHDAIHEPIPETSEYVENVLEAGVLADIVGLPYLHKSAVALELAAKVARGRGLLLGKHPIKAQAKVAYFWADDSRPQELKRIQAYQRACQDDVLPLAFYLNPGITLPDDLPAVKAQIREHGYRLCVFDSLYNFGPLGLDWSKDSGPVLAIYTALKRLCDDIEGLTIILVDHASKPSDSNKGRDDSIASFGTVWKAAAVRCSIVVTKRGKTLFVSATGNNVKGFPQTPAWFNEERLELTVLDTDPDPEREEHIEDAVLDYVRRNPGKSSNQIRQAVKGRNADKDAAIRRLADKNLICDTYKSSPQLFGAAPGERAEFHNETSPQEPGAKKSKTCWIPVNHAEEPRPADDGATPGEPRPATVSFPAETSPQSSPLYVVEGSVGEPAGETKDPPRNDNEPDGEWFQ